jgi:MFS family permease
MRRSFWLLWSASTLSALGDGIRYVAFPLIAFGYSHDPSDVALVFAAGYLPWPVFGLVGGVASDRFDRRTLMWVTNLARAAVVSALLIAMIARHDGVAALMLVSFLIGTAATVFDSSASSIVPQIVDPPRIEAANSRLMSAQTVASSLVGAVVGALLFEAWRAAPLVVDVSSFVVAAALIGLMGPIGRPAPGPPSTVMADIRTGMQWLWRHRVLRAVCGLVTIVNGVIAMAETLLLPYADRVLHLEGIGYALLLALLALSTVAGTAIAPATRRRVGYGTVLIGGAILLGAAVIIAGVSSTLAMSVVALTLAGLANGAWNVVAVSLRQIVVPGHLLGRVTSIYRTISLTAMPVGAALAGYVADRLGVHAPFIAGGVLLVVAGVVAVPMLASLSEATNQMMATLNGDEDATHPGPDGSVQP